MAHLGLAVLAGLAVEGSLDRDAVAVAGIVGSGRSLCSGHCSNVSNDVGRSRRIGSLVSRIALWIARIVLTELTTLLTVLEPAVNWWTEAILSCWRAEAGFWLAILSTLTVLRALAVLLAVLLRLVVLALLRVALLVALVVLVVVGAGHGDGCDV